MLTLTNVTKRFGRTCAVDGVSMEMQAGEVFGLLGPNGAGKTTTLRMAVGLNEPDTGTVTLRGVGDPCHAHVRKSIGYSPQSLCMYDELTARENLALMAGLYGLRRQQAKPMVQSALDLVGLADRADERTGVYSVGMKRRLTLASAIVHEPKLLVLDEPTAGVDPQSRNAIFDIIRSLRERGTSILYTTHFMEEAELLCDRVAILDHGRVIAVDRVEALIGAVEAKHAASLSTKGLPRGVRRPHVSALEQLFLDLTGRELRDT